MDSTFDENHRARELLGRMTLEEKAALVVGRDLWTTQPVERLGIRSIWLSDGPHGLRKVSIPTWESRKSEPATCFPTESALAASWDVELAREVGRAIGIEAQALDVQIVLAPGVNLKRSPLGGRNFEYFSEDPVLAGELAAAYVNGLQGEGVGASLKHFVANENETDRFSADSIVDERTLRELYLRPFEIVVEKANPWTVMAAYNRLNGTYCAENRWLLHNVLKTDWGFRGIVISDWLAVNDRVAGIEAGLHLQMPDGPTAASVVSAARSGQLDEGRLDEVVAELLAVILRADANRRPDVQVDDEEHNRLARRVAGDCIVLLKNNDGMLPLGGDQLRSVAVIGAFAKTPRIQGAGSSLVSPTRIENAYHELEALLEPTGHVTYASGYSADETPDPELLAEARAIAKQATSAIVFVGLPAGFEAEGVDRSHLDLPAAHNALVETVLAVQPNSVIVLTNGAAVRMPWAARAPAIVESWLGGQAVGGAIADVLLGRVNPSGKLAETFPMRLADTPSYLSFPNAGHDRVPFTEGLFTGYRWYDAREIEPLFPFGHGLSYTTFQYSDLSVDKPVMDADGLVHASITVRNTGSCSGSEVVQLYLHDCQPEAPRPVRELKAFTKISLEPGASGRVRFELRERDFATYDQERARWVAHAGVYEIQIGASSRDIRLAARVTLEGTALPPARLTRLSYVREWLDHPKGRPLLEPLVSPLAGSPNLPLLDDLPIAKLLILGVISEDDLELMLATANGSDSPTHLPASSRRSH